MRDYVWTGVFLLMDFCFLGLDWPVFSPLCGPSEVLVCDHVSPLLLQFLFFDVVPELYLLSARPFVVYVFLL